MTVTRENSASNPPPGAIVEMRKVKWGGSVKVSHHVEVLASDDYGLWLGGEAGAEFALGEGDVWLADVASVTCIAPDLRWNIVFLAAPRRNLYLDVFHTSRWVKDDCYEYLDLDLDVYGLDDLEIVDIEELETNAELLAYPRDLIAEAWSTANAALKAGRSGIEPYATVGWRYLEAFEQRA